MNQCRYRGLVSFIHQKLMFISDTLFPFIHTVIAPKFDELSDKYPDAVFLKVGGDIIFSFAEKAFI